jgi:cell wall-associated NlpC family hydrolase
MARTTLFGRTKKQRRKLVKGSSKSTRGTSRRDLSHSNRNDKAQAKMSSQLDLFIQTAWKEVGYVEGKNNSTKFGAKFGVNNLPWCGSFIMWCAQKAGVKIPNVISTAAGATAFQKAGKWFDAADADPRPGDLAFFDFPGDGVDRISHIGIVVGNNGDGTVTTIEGNTSSDKKGDQRNGGEVCFKERAYKKKNRGKLRRSLPVAIVGFGRPTFKE